MEKDIAATVTDDPIIVVPVLPLRDVVVYPHMVIPLFVGREKSIKALEAAMEGNKQILLVAQKNAAVDDPQMEDLYKVGTLSSVLQLLKLPDGTIKVLVEGAERATIVSVVRTHDYLSGQVAKMVSLAMEDREVEVMSRSVLTQFDQYVKLNKKIPPEILSALASIDDPGRLADTVAAHMTLKLEEKQTILEMDNVRARFEHLMGIMESEIDLLQVEKRIRGRVKR
ncbi:MAG: LON peptidase substrate-binding domain-containing protein, partial [Gammaproteobacteria bacterium]